MSMYNLSRLEISFYLIAQLVIYKSAASDFSREHRQGSLQMEEPSQHSFTYQRVGGGFDVLCLSFLPSQTLELFLCGKEQCTFDLNSV